MLENFAAFILNNTYRIPDLFFGLIASLGGLSLLSIIIVFFTGNGGKGTIQYIHFSFWLSLMMITPAVMYYLMITRFGYDKWISAFAGMFIMFILSNFVRKVALSNEE